jgi:hypothetical protein
MCRCKCDIMFCASHRSIDASTALVSQLVQMDCSANRVHNYRSEPDLRSGSKGVPWVYLVLWCGRDQNGSIDLTKPAPKDQGNCGC